MRALVTGSDGFIGRHITVALRNAGYDEVWGIDPKQENWLVPGGDCREAFRGHSTHFNDMSWDPWDLVVHCAALVDGRETIEDKAAKLAAYNLSLDAAMFEWALTAKPRRIVYFSSSAAYPVDLQRGRYCGHLLAERDTCTRIDPDQTYGWVKLIGEKVAAEVRHAGVPVTVVRPFSGYGTDQDQCYPFPAMVRRANRLEDPFDVWGDGQQVRDFIHVDDICAAVLTLVNAEVDGPVNLGTGRATSMDELAWLCMSEAGYDAEIRHLAAKPAGVQYRVADTAAMFRHYKPTVSLEQGIRRAMSGRP